MLGLNGLFNFKIFLSKFTLILSPRVFCSISFHHPSHNFMHSVNYINWFQFNSIIYLSSHYQTHKVFILNNLHGSFLPIMSMIKRFESFPSNSILLLYWTSFFKKTPVLLLTELFSSSSLKLFMSSNSLLNATSISVS